MKPKTSEDDDFLEYQIPELDKRDLKIQSNIPESNLKYIYVLDDELSGKEYQGWKKTSQNIFTPLFRKFVAAPELPQLPFNLPFLESLDSKLDPYARMKQELFFHGLIIQID